MCRIGHKNEAFFEHVPVSICQLADELHFPIIDFQTDETLGAVINESLSFILDKNSRASASDGHTSAIFLIHLTRKRH